jgi:hypothetical protein
MIPATLPARGERFDLFLKNPVFDNRAWIFHHSVLHRRAIFFKNENDAQFSGVFVQHGEAYSVGAVGGKTRASSARATPVANVALHRFGGLEGVRGATHAAIRLDQRKAWGVKPLARIHQLDRLKIRASHTASCYRVS